MSVGRKDQLGKFSQALKYKNLSPTLINFENKSSHVRFRYYFLKINVKIPHFITTINTLQSIIHKKLHPFITIRISRIADK